MTTFNPLSYLPRELFDLIVYYEVTRLISQRFSGVQMFSNGGPRFPRQMLALAHVSHNFRGSVKSALSAHILAEVAQLRRISNSCTPRCSKTPVSGYDLRFLDIGNDLQALMAQKRMPDRDEVFLEVRDRCELHWRPGVGLQYPEGVQECLRSCWSLVNALRILNIRPTAVRSRFV